MRNIAVTLECFIKKNETFLMLKRHETNRIMPGVWMAAGGHVEFGEGLFAAARREVLEETGMTIRNIQVRACGTAVLHDLNQEFFFHLLLADYQSGELPEVTPDGTFEWLTLDEIIKLPNLLAELKPIVAQVLDCTKPVVSYRAEYNRGNELQNFEIEK